MGQRTNPSAANYGREGDIIRLDPSLKHFIKHLLHGIEVSALPKHLESDVVENGLSGGFNPTLKVAENKGHDKGIGHVVDDSYSILL